MLTKSVSRPICSDPDRFAKIQEMGHVSYSANSCTQLNRQNVPFFSDFESLSKLEHERVSEKGYLQIGEKLYLKVANVSPRLGLVLTFTLS